MKSIKILATVGAIALLGMAGLSSCKTNNAPEIESGAEKYNGETVKTRLLISITGKAADDNNIYRMPAAQVQESGAFLGMDSIRLLPFADAALATRTGKTDIKLAPLTTFDNTTSNAKVYSNVQIPLGTKYFLFYGKAIDSTEVLTSDLGKHTHGIVTAPGLYANGANNKATSAIEFNLVPLNESPSLTVANNLAAYLTTIANAKDAGDHAWKDHSNLGIKALYTDFTTKMKAGSSHSVLSAVNDLYNSLNRYQSEQDPSDAVVAAVISAITARTDVTAGPSGAFADTLKWKAAEKVNYANYPDNVDLPEGAATVAWADGTPGSFSVTNTTNLGNLGAAINRNTFVYPPSLWYFTKSAILTSNSSEAEHYSEAATWMTIKSNYTAGDSVTTATASVAIKDSINYGVGQLKSMVKVNAGPLKDSKEINRTPVLGWKGILVGGQKKVDYKFEQVSASENIFTIYDNYLASKDSLNRVLTLTAGADYCDPNYTLVFSSKDNDSDNDLIYVALELVNLGEPFYGVGLQLIPKGGTFYMVGALSTTAIGEHPTTDPSYTNRPAHHNIFYKDYQTVGKFFISSLKNAYYTIPDLRTEGLELGLSVDLNWTAGYTFEVEL